MRHVLSVSAGTLLWTVVLIFSIKLRCAWASSEERLMGENSDDDLSQLEGSMLKKDWSKNLHSWGKRAWSNLQGGWGKRDSLYYPYNGKRAWQNLQGGWGKRYVPDDEFAYRLAAILEQEEQEPHNEFDRFNEPEKRDWKKSDGSSDKRNPAWTHLKGMWGKRSYPERITQ